MSASSASEFLSKACMRVAEVGGRSATDHTESAGVVISSMFDHLII